MKKDGWKDCKNQGWSMDIGKEAFRCLLMGICSNGGIMHKTRAQSRAREMGHRTALAWELSVTDYCWARESRSDTTHSDSRG